MKSMLDVGNKHQLENWCESLCCLCLTDKVKLVADKPFKGEKGIDILFSYWVLNCIFNVGLRSVCNEGGMFLCQRISLHVAAMFQNLDNVC